MTIQFFTAVYGGFFGAGMGFLMLASLGLTEGTDYHRINALKQVLAVIIQAVAIVIFIRGGIISWPEALVTMAAAIAGGYLGVGVARKVPGHIMRGFCHRQRLGADALLFLDHLTGARAKEVRAGARVSASPLRRGAIRRSLRDGRN